MDTIKLLELFSGIQSQEKALKAIGAPYESVGVCELDKDCLVSAAAMRFNLEEEMTKYNFPIKEDMVCELQRKNIGWDFKKNCHTITNKTNIDKVKLYYICDKLLKNIGDISLVKRMPYADLVTYSFCCQDLSCAGKGEGMKLTCDKCGHSWVIDFAHPEHNDKCPNCGNVNLNSTRSGLLSQVQRLLDIAYKHNELPKWLALENVKQLTGKKFKPQFDAWIQWLDSIGYNTYWKVLNAKNFGVPQNRERVFAISIRKDIDNGAFHFPKPIPLTSRLKDVLCTNVPEKYYLPDERVQKIIDKLNELYPEPICVASRGRNPENPSDRTAGAPTEQRFELNTTGCTNTITSVAKDAYIAEPQMLRAERTEYGKEIRKKYESGEIYEHIGNMREIAPRTDGISNTVTTILKDTYIAEPQLSEDILVLGNYMPSGHDASRIVDIDGIAPCVKENHGTVTAIAEPQLEFVGGIGNKDWAKDGKQLSRNYPQGLRVYSADGIATSLTAQGVGSAGGYSGLYAVDEPIVYDDYNSKIPQEQDICTTLTTNCGAHAERNGVKILEPVIVEDFYQSRDIRTYAEEAPTLRSERIGLKVGEGTELPCSTQGKQIVSTLRASMYKQGARNLEENVVNNRGYEGIIEDGRPRIRWRIRKLMEKETWRLMGFTDEDYERAANYVVSSQIYKQAGNSICTCCLVSIFYSLFFGDSSVNWQQYLIHYDDKTE